MTRIAECGREEAGVRLALSFVAAGDFNGVLLFVGVFRSRLQGVEGYI